MNGYLNLSVSEEVPTFDLTEVRKGTGYTVSGVIGMDFLRRYVIRIDFDNGKLVFLRSADHQQGVSIPLRDGPGHVPHVVADVAGIQKQSFIVDTGACGYGSCIVTTSLFDRLIQAKSLTLLGNRLVSSANGTVKSREGKLKNVSLGQFQHDDLVCGESLFQILGLEYWSRFVVTFDFPGQKMYLDKGKRYGHADSWNVSGLHIIRNDGSTVVHSVDEGSPAAACNIKSKDVILQVGTTKATDVSLFTLHHLLAVTDQAIPIIVRRGDLEIHSSLDLRKLPASPAK